MKSNDAVSLCPSTEFESHKHTAYADRACSRTPKCFCTLRRISYTNVVCPCCALASAMSWLRHCCKEEYSLVLGTSSYMQKMHEQPSCLTHPFILTRAVLFLICKLTVASNRNTQWPSGLCQCCLSQSYPLSTREIYRCFVSVPCMANP